MTGRNELTLAVIKLREVEVNVKGAPHRDAAVYLLVQAHLRLHGADRVRVAAVHDRLFHGEGVSVGMVLAADLSVELGLLAADDAARVKKHLAESGLPGYAADNWYGFLAPAGTPRAVLEKLNPVLIKANDAPEFVKSRASTGSSLALRGSTWNQRSAISSDERGPYLTRTGAVPFRG